MLKRSLRSSWLAPRQEHCYMSRNKCLLDTPGQNRCWKATQLHIEMTSVGCIEKHFIEDSTCPVTALIRTERSQEFLFLQCSFLNMGLLYSVFYKNCLYSTSVQWNKRGKAVSPKCKLPQFTFQLKKKGVWCTICYFKIWKKILSGVFMYWILM